MDYTGDGFYNLDISSLRKTESEIEISKVEKLALDRKMSYGQYVAMIEEEKRKEKT